MLVTNFSAYMGIVYVNLSRAGMIYSISALPNIYQLMWVVFRVLMSTRSIRPGSKYQANFRSRSNVRLFVDIFCLLSQVRMQVVDFRPTRIVWLSTSYYFNVWCMAIQRCVLDFRIQERTSDFPISRERICINTCVCSPAIVVRFMMEVRVGYYAVFRGVLCPIFVFFRFIPMSRIIRNGSSDCYLLIAS